MLVYKEVNESLKLVPVYQATLSILKNTFTGHEPTTHAHILKFQLQCFQIRSVVSTEMTNNVCSCAKGGAAMADNVLHQ